MFRGQPARASTSRMRLGTRANTLLKGVAGRTGAVLRDGPLRGAATAVATFLRGDVLMRGAAVRAIGFLRRDTLLRGVPAAGFLSGKALLPGTPFNIWLRGEALPSGAAI